MKAVVLSGGGFSGFWPLLGAAVELRRRHKITHWAGTSAGAIVAAAMATNAPIDKLVAHATAEDLAPRKIQPSGPALLDNSRLRDLMRRFLPATMPKKTPLRIVTTNLVTGRAMVWSNEHDWAPLRSIVLASASIPLVFRPVKIGRYWHVDGGVTHNLLADAFPNVPTIAVSAFSGEHSPRPKGLWPRLGWTASRTITAAMASNLREDIEDADELERFIAVRRLPGKSRQTRWLYPTALRAMELGAQAV